jgi:hypothetical protein
MPFAILGAPLITEPNVIPVSHQLECGSCIVIVHDPAIRRIYNPMLHEHCRILNSLLKSVLLKRCDSIDVEDVTIFGGDRVNLIVKPIVTNYFFESFESIWIYFV